MSTCAWTSFTRLRYHHLCSCPKAVKLPGCPPAPASLCSPPPLFPAAAQIAGAAAARGAPLSEVAALARSTVDACATLGVALRPCTLPGKEPDTERLAGESIEVGLGIHGEPGVDTRAALPVDELVGASGAGGGRAS
eukprot:358641-Chlamydomonas_euryale.AAC.5